MMDILGLVAIGVAAFAATNIDDIFVLMLFFSSLTFAVRQVVLGQYIGIGLLTAISVLGSLISLVVPTYVIGLLGIIPIAICIKNLVGISKKDKSHSTQVVQDKKTKSNLSFLAVAAVTISKSKTSCGLPFHFRVSIFNKSSLKEDWRIMLARSLEKGKGNKESTYGVGYLYWLS